jgi:hypothetical protein
VSAWTFLADMPSDSPTRDIGVCLVRECRRECRATARLRCAPLPWLTMTRTERTRQNVSVSLGIWKPRHKNGICTAQNESCADTRFDLNLSTRSYPRYARQQEGYGVPSTLIRHCEKISSTALLQRLTAREHHLQAKNVPTAPNWTCCVHGYDGLDSRTSETPGGTTGLDTQKVELSCANSCAKKYMTSGKGLSLQSCIPK